MQFCLGIPIQKVVHEVPACFTSKYNTLNITMATGLCGTRRSQNITCVIVRLYLAWLIMTQTCRGNSIECPRLNDQTMITLDLITEGCRGQQRLICNYLEDIQQYRKEASELLTQVCLKYERSSGQPEWLNKVQSNNRYITDQLYINLKRRVTILENNNKIDTLMKTHLVQYLGSRSSAKLSFFSFIDKLMQPLEYKLSTIYTFVDDLQSENAFMESAVIREIKISSVQNLIKLCSEFHINYNISYLETCEEKNMAVYLKMFSGNVSSSDANVLKSGHHAEYATIYKKYGRRAERYPVTWRVVMDLIRDGLQNVNTSETFETLNQYAVFPTESLNIFNTLISKLRYKLDTDPDPEMFRVKLKSVFPFTLKGIDWIKNITKAIEQKELSIIRLAEKRDWLEVMFQMYLLIQSYSMFVGRLFNFHTGLTAEQKTSQSEVEGLSEICVGEFQDILNILDTLRNITTSRYTPEQHGMVSLEYQYIPGQIKGLGLSNIILHHERKLLPWIVSEFNLERLGDWMEARLSLYEELSRSSDYRKSVSGILSSLAAKFCKYGGQSVTLDTVVSPGDILCTLSTVRMDFNDYDSYPLQILRDKCGSSNYPTSVLCCDTVNQRKVTLVEQAVREAIANQRQGDVDFIFDCIYNKLRNDAISKKYGLTVSKLDILHTVSKLYPQMENFGFYQVSLFKHSSLSEDAFNLLLSFAIERRNLFTRQTLRKQFCDVHGFCTEHKSSIGNITSEQIHDMVHIVVEKGMEAPAQKQAAHRIASVAPRTHMNIHYSFLLLVFFVIL
ncbi:uncharacterized protein [Argopecten irradians]|uniref:uncharacterized protein isoform X1 n=1 Tax=Argopecten irradians TaxID=31199 RepID=UPI003723FAD6